MIALLLSLAATPSFAADWNNVVSCENMAIDQTAGGSQLQLVIRNADTVRYFSGKADVSRMLNDKGELVFGVERGGPVAADYVGYVGGVTNVVISKDADGSVKVALVNSGYRGATSEELANWVFRGCSAN